MCVADLLFGYKVLYRLRRVCVCLHHKTASVMQSCEIWGDRERGICIFGQEPPGRKHVLMYRSSDTSRNATCRHDEESKKRVGGVSNCLFAQTTHVELGPPKLSCGLGSETQSYISSFIEVSSGVLTPRGVKIRHFPILSIMACIAG